MKNETLYKKFIYMKNEIHKHKWLESEKANRDVGFENALVDWIRKHRVDWRKSVN